MALAVRSSDSALMPPPPAPTRIKRPAKVLDEDDYTDALSQIIARDFFPGLLETESQQEYLEALESKDPAWISSAGQKLRTVMTPGPDGRRLRGKRGTSLATPVTISGQDTPQDFHGDTPLSEASSLLRAGPSEKRPVDTNMSLGAFQEKYTSEDNESFYKLLDKQNMKRADKYAWMWAGNKIPAPRQIAHRNRQRLMAVQALAEDTENGKQLANIAPRDTRQAMPDTWTADPRNAFMFAPDSIEDSKQTVAQKNEENSLAPPRAVAYDNTRMQPSSSMNGSDRPSSPTLSAVKDAIAGHPRPTTSEASGSTTPRVNGYGFVDSEDPEPAQLVSLSNSQLLLENSEATSNPFTLKESSRREALHHRMVDKISKGKRANKPSKREGEIMLQATPKFLSSPRPEKKGALTPAAERLLGKVGGTRGGKTPTLWDKKTPRRSGLRNAVTPKIGE